MESGPNSTSQLDAGADAKPTKYALRQAAPRASQQVAAVVGKVGVGKHVGMEVVMLLAAVGSEQSLLIEELLAPLYIGLEPENCSESGLKRAVCGD